MGSITLLLHEWGPEWLESEAPARILSIAVQLGLDGDRHVVNGVWLLEVAARSQTLGDLDPGGFREPTGNEIEVVHG